jgi:hypothetical protein
MLAEEIGSSSNRGSVIWILASGRTDLIEVDLKRPSRVDVKIPLFPTSTKQESFDLVRMLLKNAVWIFGRITSEPWSHSCPCF